MICCLYKSINMSVLEMLDEINKLEIKPEEVELVKAKLEILKSKLEPQNIQPYKQTIDFLRSIAIDNPNNVTVTEEDLY